MCWTGPFEFRWLEEYIHNPSYYHQIRSIHLSHCRRIFPWFCVLRWLYYHILSSITYISREHCDLVSIIDVQSMVFANDRILYGLCSYVWHHLVIIIMQTYLYAAECVSNIKTVLSFILYSIYGAVCLQLTQLPCDDRENAYFILASSSNRMYESLTIV